MKKIKNQKEVMKNLCYDLINIIEKTYTKKDISSAYRYAIEILDILEPKFKDY